MIKKILIIIVMLFLTGCTVEYNLIFDGKEIYETANMKFINDKVTDKNILEYADDYVCNNINCQEYYVDLYSHKNFINNGNVTLRSSRLYSDENLNSSIALQTCFNGVRIENNDIFKLTTTQGFRCFDKLPELEEIKINLETKHPVLNGNYDEVDKNLYSWIINKENASDFKIEVEIAKDKYYNIKQHLKIVIIFSILVLLGLLMYVFIKQLKYRKI